METNMNPKLHSELEEKGQLLIDAAYNFWEIHQRACGSCAVVWLKDSSGHLVLFTRSEYLDDLMRNIQPLTKEVSLSEPFICSK